MIDRISRETLCMIGHGGSPSGPAFGTSSYTTGHGQISIQSSPPLVSSVITVLYALGDGCPCPCTIEQWAILTVHTVFLFNAYDTVLHDPRDSIYSKQVDQIQARNGEKRPRVRGARVHELSLVLYSKQRVKLSYSFYDLRNPKNSLLSSPPNFFFFFVKTYKSACHSHSLVTRSTCHYTIVQPYDGSAQLILAPRVLL